MTYLVDTDWVADWLSGRPRATSVLSSLRSDGLAISLITYGEIYEGIYFGRAPAAQERSFRQFLRFVDVSPLTRTIMQRFARIRGALRQQGRLIPDADLLIAAPALSQNHTLVTGNIRHFQRIPGLQLYRSS